MGGMTWTAVGNDRGVEMSRQLVNGWSEQGCERAAAVAKRARSRLRRDYPAVLGGMARRRTRCERCALSAQTAPTSQCLKRADARGHASCAPRRRPIRHRGSPLAALRHCSWWGTNEFSSWPATTGSTRPWAALRRGVSAGAEQRRDEGGARQRASTTDSPGLFERRAQRARSEFPGAPSFRAAQGSRPAGPTARRLARPQGCPGPCRSTRPTTTEPQP
jgi:hypothetical protein